MVRSFKAFVLIGGVMAIGLATGGHLTRSAFAKGANKYSDLDTLAQAMHHVESQYLNPVTTLDLVYGAIHGIMDALDTHSVFLDPSQMAAAEIRTEGFFSGIGVEVKRIRDDIVIVRVVPESPSEGRLQRGDVLIEIDGRPVEGLNSTSESLQGEADTTVHLQFRRGTELLSETLTRARLRDRTVRVDPLQRGWAYAEISRFQRNTASDLKRGIQKAAPTKGVILDLRGNGGGLLDEAVDVVNLFSTSGLIVETRGRDGDILERHNATSDAPLQHLKILILVDSESASASEIVSGSLRTLVDARLIGTQTWGKWSVQRLYVFEDKSAIKLTVAQYFLPGVDGTEDKVGLKPDIEVHRSTRQAMAMTELKKRLKTDTRSQELLEIVEENLEQTSSHPYLGSLDDRLTHDPQLEAAWTLARTNR